MNYRHEFPALANFLGSWFPDADLEGCTDEEVVTAFVATNNIQHLHSVQSELTRLLHANAIPWQEIGNDANRYFENEADCRRWLSDIKQLLLCQRPIPRNLSSNSDPNKDFR